MAVLKDLIVHGPSRFVGITEFTNLKANKIKATEGIFNKLIATTADFDSMTANNATVVGLLDVKGELHTNSWTNSNIATIEGSFYITPTISCESGTFNYDGTNITLTAGSGYSFAISSLYINSGDNAGTTIAWSAYSEVLITGQVAVGNEKVPLGTIKGKITSTTPTTSKIIINSLTDGKGTTSNVLASIGTGSKDFYDIKISLLKRGNGSNVANALPIGIYMTAMGQNGTTFLDIYGGHNAASTAVAGGLAKPVLRIGNLSGLPDVGGKTPGGYGIYTSNGYFTGTIVSTSGTIGNWSITSSSIQTGAFNTASKMYFGKDGISLGTTFRVTSAGVLTATSGIIGGYSLTANYLQSTDGTTGISVADNSTTASWAFWAGGTSTSTVKFRVDHNGVLYAKGAQIDGDITAAKLIIASNATITDNTGQLSNDAIQIGGTNLMLSTNVREESAQYDAYDIYLSEPLESDQIYTLQLWDISISHSAKAAADLGPDIYYCGGSVRLGGWHGTSYITNGHAKHLQIVFTPHTSSNATCVGGNQSPSGNLSHSSVVNASTKFIRIYNSVGNADGTRNLVIGNFKLEKGNKGTAWSPAPEDIDVNLSSLSEDVSDVSSNLNETSSNLGALTTKTNSLDSYVHGHVVVTPQGLNIQPDTSVSKSKLQLTTSGVSLINHNGDTIATFGTNVTLGNENSTHVQLTSQELGFYLNKTNKVAYISSQTLNITQAEIKNTLKIGKFTWQTTGTERISLIYTP